MVLSAEEQRALDLAYKALNRRDRTVAELRVHLEGKRVEPEAIVATLEELQRSGFVDDARFAQRLVEDKQSLDSWGVERIERELARRGVPPEAAEAALAASDAESELDRALAVLAVKAPEPPTDDRGRDRIWRLLVRKGYAPEIAYDAVRAHAAR